MRRSGEGRLFWASFRRSYPIRATALGLIASLTVVSCGREGAAARSIDRINYDSLPAEAPRPTKPADKLHAVATELGELLAIQAKSDLSNDQADDARAARSRIAGELRAIERQFDADRAKLTKLGADAALARLDRIEARATRISGSLQAALTRVPADGDRAGRSAAQADKLLRALSPSERSQPLSSDLGFGIKNAKPRQASLNAGITPAYNAPGPNEVPSELPRTPAQEDLAETPETKVTPAIHALAVELDRDPVKIYEHVRNKIAFEPYYGIRKGADQTLAEQGGSDADQAALLIALLRDSGIHARFVQGVAELPAAKAANWVGVNVADGERLDATTEILWAGGFPVTQIRSNGELTKVRFGHVWAEAYLPSDAYRGVSEGLGGEAWLPLDASMKETHFKAPVADLEHLIGPIVEPWAERFAADSEAVGDDGIIAPPSAAAAVETKQLFDDVAAKLEDAAGEDALVSDVVGERTIAERHLPYLSGTTPFKTLAVQGEQRALPRSLHASVTLSVSGADPLSTPDYDLEGGSDGFTFSATTDELVNKRVTVAYVPASSEDAEIIDAYHGLLNAPSYAASLIPVLRVDGEVVARGNRAVSTGYAQNFRITYRMPGFAADVVENPVYVGSVSAFVLDLGTASGPQIRERGDAWRNASRDITVDNLLTDGVIGEAYSMLGSAYFNRNDTANTVLAQAGGVRQQRSVSGLVMATDVTPTYIASFPVGTRLTGTYIDVDQDAQAVVGLEDAEEGPAQYMRLSGANSSAQEGLIFEDAFNVNAVSSMKVMKVAGGQGIPIYSITQTNAAGLLPQLNISREAREEVAEAVSRPGVEVVIPRDEVTIGGWRGSGYIIHDDGSTGYRIMGGASGGFMSFLEAANDYTSITYWLERWGGPDWLVSTSNCVGFGSKALSMALGITQADSIWGLVTMIAGRLLPIALTGVGLLLFTTIFMILFFSYIFFTVYSATEGGPRCRDDLNEATGG